MVENSGSEGLRGRAKACRKGFALAVGDYTDNAKVTKECPVGSHKLPTGRYTHRLMDMEEPSHACRRKSTSSLRSTIDAGE